jgi:hypothetical protein
MGGLPGAQRIVETGRRPPYLPIFWELDLDGPQSVDRVLTGRERSKGSIFIELARGISLNRRFALLLCSVLREKGRTGTVAQLTLSFCPQGASIEYDRSIPP